MTQTIAGHRDKQKYSATFLKCDLFLEKKKEFKKSYHFSQPQLYHKNSDIKEGNSEISKALCLTDIPAEASVFHEIAVFTCCSKKSQ